MFRDRDLPLRLAAALLPPRLGYALTRRLTPLVGGARGRYVADAVAAAAQHLLGDADLAARAGRGFAASIACDDLDAVTAWLWPAALRTAAVVLEGAEHLPQRGPAVFVSFHLGGGFRVFDVLQRRGLAPAVLAAPPAAGGNLYDRALAAMRFAYLRRTLGERVLPVGRDVPRTALRSPAPHLADGGSVIALLDVAPQELGVRDAALVPLLGRMAALPNGILRLAASAGAAVLPFDGRLEGDRRILRFHPPLRSASAAELTAQVAQVFERVIRERPWDWQGWLDAERLLREPGAASPPTAAPSPGDAARRTEACDAAHPLAIVVPVFDARADVAACLTSVLRHMPSGARLIVVDDASTDASLVAWLDALARDDARVCLLRNLENQGFVRAANRGMREAAGGDVLLLNSDTVVAAGFATALAAAARHTQRTGIVSPLTNNGTVCSVPEFMQDNDVPADLGVDGMAQLVAATGLRARPELVTAVGFCLYLRAEVLAAVGLFDEQSFGRGYGEENDLCERAKAAGFEVRLCDDAFVYHHGRASFGASGSARERANLDVLGRLHPGYHAAVQGFIRANPLAATQANVKYQLARRAARRERALLVLLHADPLADPRRENVGGTQLHVRDLVRELALPRTVLAFPEGDALCALEVENGAVDAARAHRFAAPPSPRFALDDPASTQRLAELVERFDVGAAHLHHLLFWPISAWRVLHEHDVPYAFTIHDYYAVCPSWNLFDFGRGERCACLHASREERRACLASLFAACELPPPNEPEALLERHRLAWSELLANAAALIAPSRAARDVVAAAHPAIAQRICVVPHGYGAGRRATARATEAQVDALGAAAQHAAAQRADGESAHPSARAADGAGRVLRVALLGAPAAPWKGAQATLETMRRCGEQPIEWHVFGVADAYGFAAAAQQALAGRAAGALHLHGRYEREAIGARLRAQHIDVTLHLSPWDETYAYTLTESWLAGIPAIVSNRGALAERAQESGAAWIARDAAEAAQQLAALAGDPDALAQLRARARAVEIPSAADNAAAHRAVLAPLLARLTSRAAPRPFDATDRELFLAHRRALADDEPSRHA